MSYFEHAATPYPLADKHGDVPNGILVDMTLTVKDDYKDTAKITAFRVTDSFAFLAIETADEPLAHVHVVNPVPGRVYRFDAGDGWVVFGPVTKKGYNLTEGETLDLDPECLIIESTDVPEFSLQVNGKAYEMPEVLNIVADGLLQLAITEREVYTDIYGDDGELLSSSSSSGSSESSSVSISDSSNSSSLNSSLSSSLGLSSSSSSLGLTSSSSSLGVTSSSSSESSSNSSSSSESSSSSSLGFSSSSSSSSNSSSSQSPSSNSSSSFSTEEWYNSSSSQSISESSRGLSSSSSEGLSSSSSSSQGFSSSSSSQGFSSSSSSLGVTSSSSSSSQGFSSSSSQSESSLSSADFFPPIGPSEVVPCIEISRNDDAIDSSVLNGGMTDVPFQPVRVFGGAVPDELGNIDIIVEVEESLAGDGGVYIVLCDSQDISGYVLWTKDVPGCETDDLLKQLRYSDYGEGRSYELPFDALLGALKCDEEPCGPQSPC